MPTSEICWKSGATRSRRDKPSIQHLFGSKRQTELLHVLFGKTGRRSDKEAQFTFSKSFGHSAAPPRASCAIHSLLRDTKSAHTHGFAKSTRLSQSARKMDHLALNGRANLRVIVIVSELPPPSLLQPTLGLTLRSNLRSVGSKVSPRSHNPPFQMRPQNHARSTQNHDE